MSLIASRLVALIDPGSISADLQALASAPRLAGSPDGARMAAYVEEAFLKAGLRTTRSTYRVLLPYPVEVRLERTAPRPAEVPTNEEGLVDDEASRHPAIPIPYLAFSPSGDVEGEIVYANYALKGDFAALAAAGVSVAGKIVIARYGNAFRGEKVRLAAEKGAIACILFSDPADDGFARGDVLPKGPWRPWGGVQRGSILTMVGDPLTPGWAATADSRRREIDEAGLPAIPALPLSYGSAALLLADLGGPSAPRGWQGGLPFTYHLGPGPVRAHLELTMEFALREIHDIIAEIPGSVEPDHPVILGAHGDSWGPGASDNGGGIACLLEVGRALAALTREGWRPRRTIMLGSWDAEEFGIMGSTEWVEENEAALRRAAAYLNVDGVASGPRFEVSASPSLAGLFREIAADLPSPDGEGTLLAAWRRASGSGGQETTVVGTLGGGSDFAPFLNHLGVPSANHSFSGEGGGAYHSALDTWRFVSRFLDPGMVHHAAAARVWAMAAVRLASAAVIPYDTAATGRDMRAALDEIRGATLPGVDAVREAIAHADQAALGLEISAARFRRAVENALAGDEPPSDSTLIGVNDLVIDAERALISNDGLPGRPWYRYLLAAPSDGSGYGTRRLPGVRDALDAGEPGTAERQLGLLVNGAGVAERRLREAAKLIRGR